MLPPGWPVYLCDRCCADYGEPVHQALNQALNAGWQAGAHAAHGHLQPVIARLSAQLYRETVTHATEVRALREEIAKRDEKGNQMPTTTIGGTRTACPIHGELCQANETYCYQCGLKNVREYIPQFRCHCGREFCNFIPNFCGTCGAPVRAVAIGASAKSPGRSRFGAIGVALILAALAALAALLWQLAS